MAPKTAPDPDPDATRQLVADELLTAMSSIRRSNRRFAGRPVELSSLTGSQIELVRLVRRRPRLTVADAATELKLASNTISTLVRQLVEAGLLLRHVDSSDRRVVRLDLTSEMRRKVDAWRDRRVLVISAAIGQLSEGDERCLVDAVGVLTRVGEILEAQPSK